MNDMPQMNILEERHGAVLVLTIDYPSRRNALPLPLREKLEHALERASVDGVTRAVVLTGAGGVFSEIGRAHV